MDYFSKILLGCFLLIVGLIALAHLVGYLSDELPNLMGYGVDSIKEHAKKRKISKYCKNNIHQWNGCKCTLCGKVRDSHHRFSRESSSSLYWTPGKSSTCQICGKTCNHRDKNGLDLGNSNCRCKICGSEVHRFVDDDEWWDDKRNLYKFRCHCIRCGFTYHQ